LNIPSTAQLHVTFVQNKIEFTVLYCVVVIAAVLTGQPGHCQATPIYTQG